MVRKWVIDCTHAGLLQWLPVSNHVQISGFRDDVSGDIKWRDMPRNSLIQSIYPPFTHHLHAIDHGWWAARPAKCRNQFFGFVGWDNHWDGLPDQDRATVEWKWLSQKFSRDFQRRIVFHVSEKKAEKKEHGTSIFTESVVDDLMGYNIYNL